jgi:NitT/TauT family transport system ATP-binding protein
VVDPVAGLVHDGRQESVSQLPKTTESSTPVISVRGLQRVFLQETGRQVAAVQDVTFDIPEGQFVCVTGPSGHGKTTLLHLIAGLLSPTHGEIVVRGRPITGPGADRGVVFQQDTLFMWRRVADNIAYGLEARGLPKSERDRIVAEYLRLVGLTEYARFWPKELSGGMRKRVAVATVFANDPDVLLMDEPFGSLDYVQRSHLHDVLLDLWHRSRKTILFVTHDVEEALVLADRILVVANGRIAADMLVPFPRPRTELTVAAPEAIEMRRRMLEHLGISVSAQQRLHSTGEDRR